MSYDLQKSAESQYRNTRSVARFNAVLIPSCFMLFGGIAGGMFDHFLVENVESPALTVATIVGGIILGGLAGSVLAVDITHGDAYGRGHADRGQGTDGRGRYNGGY